MVAEGMMNADRELDLVKRAQAGDRESYGRLVDLYGGLVLAIAYSRIGNYTASQDIAQDAFLLGFENLATLRQPGRFGVWLSTITRNLSRNWRKSQAYRERLHADSATLRERLGYMQAPGAAEEVERMEMRHLIDEALGELPVRDRDSIILYYFEDKSTDEAARALGISPAAMRKRLERARRRLRDRMAAHVERGLADAAKKRRMSSKVLAALPLGASFAKIAPVTSVLPSAPILHITGVLAKAGGVVMGINKTAGTVAAICAVLVVIAGGLYLTRENRRPAGPDGVPESVSAMGDSAGAPATGDWPRALPAQEAGTGPDAATSRGPSAAGAGDVSDTDEPSVATNGERDDRPDPSPGLNASISGRVTDSAMKPIAEAELKISGRGTSGSATSDEDGHYRITDVKRNAICRVTASAGGYGTVTSRPIPVPGKGDVEGVNFVFDTGALVAGYVVTTDGAFIPNATVTLQVGYSNTSSGETNERGEFEIGDVAPGAYTFLVSDGARSKRALNEPLTVAAGESITGVEVVVGAGEGFIEGFALDEYGMGIPGAEVTAQVWTGSLSAKTDRAGHYSLEGLTGSAQVIRFEHQGYSPAFLTNIPAGTIDADVVMLRHGGISGVVLAAATLQPIPEFIVRLTTSFENVDGVRFEDEGSHSFSSETGEFTIENVRPGIARLMALAAGYSGQEISGIVVESGSVTGGIEFLLSGSGTVRGVVLAEADSSPVQGAEVDVTEIADGWRETHAATAVTDSRGAFELQNLTVGQRTIKVRHPEYAYTSVPVNVSEGDVTEVTIQLSSGVSIQGYVLVDGAARSGTYVMVRALGPDVHRQNTTSDANGHYELTGLAPGAYNVAAVLTSGTEQTGPRQWASVEVEQGGTAEHDFDFHTGTGVVEGYLTQDGEPVFGVSAGVSARSVTESGPTGVAGASSADASGFYRIEGLAAGSYELSVSTEQMTAIGTHSEGMWLQSFSRDLGSASVQLEDGETAHVDIEIGGLEE
jgi:RNA polymerase sigma factor (sigma-70 family)